ncbi:hypothetical protein E2C01_043080 [Portunus trituberculatus]|uniref:Uncharacterized protein n=1 Tax=Portunus trituberculatus TaxID=210409 RepID=A0A5B7FRY6_PORTR|nr:hypothetical protein [Portunus trituberculatus]
MMLHTGGAGAVCYASMRWLDIDQEPNVTGSRGAARRWKPQVPAVRLAPVQTRREHKSKPPPNASTDQPTDRPTDRPTAIVRLGLRVQGVAVSALLTG